MIRTKRPLTYFMPLISLISLITDIFGFLMFSVGMEKGQSQSPFTCSKSTIETLEQGVKYVQS